MNQYTARTNHGFLLVEGTSSNATVKVYETGSSEETAARKNDYYFRDWDPNTSSTASAYPEINVKEGTTVSATKNAWIPAASETPITYDANGNLTGDALWSYTYDEDGARQRVDGAPQRGVPGAKRRVRKAGALWATDEQNRLISMEETAAAATAGFPDTTITFKYDYMGRRVEKKVVRGTVTESHLRFVWRGWLLARISPKSSTALRNVGVGTGIVRFPARAPHRCRPSLQGVNPASPASPLETRTSARPPFARYEFCEISGPVAELNAASDNALVKTYTWGPDISGSLGGAGGNGRVLIFKDHTSTVNESFYPAYDARGNVTGLIDTSGNLDAAYEYDPFGKLIRYAGARSASMSLLYGTKYTDMESGLIYYGHRYYDPRQGRFINRDPIAEEGGINLYGFVGNNPVNGLDFLGLYMPDECDPDHDDYDDANCLEILESRMPIHDLDEFQVIGLGDQKEIRTFLSGFGPIGDELLADFFDEYDELDYGVDNGTDNGGHSTGNGDETMEEKEEIIDKDLLIELCGSEEGRTLVDRINDENINIYTSETAFHSTRSLGFFNVTGYQRTGVVDIYVNRAVDTIGEFRDIGYSGPVRQGQALIIRHEIGEYDAIRNMPNEPPWVRDAHARWDTDQFARSAGMQPWFPNSSLQDLLDTNANSYNARSVKKSDYERITADRIKITGFDCDSLNK